MQSKVDTMNSVNCNGVYPNAYGTREIDVAYEGSGGATA